ncbi:Agamous-like MADS-box protein AGL29 [Linum perenne]
MGRRKIEMTMVKDRRCRQVTFSKRRAGIFKKAHELATLCAVQIVILVFSPGGKPFSFGSPDVDFITDRFLNQNENLSAFGNNKNYNNASVKRMNRKLDSLNHQIEDEKHKSNALKAQMMALGGSWFMKPINEMRMEELLKMKERLVMLQGELNGRAMEMDAPSTLLLLSEKQAVEDGENLGDSTISYCSE